ncbi:MAG: DUF3078 domain-containing protein [bacterium]
MKKYLASLVVILILSATVFAQDSTFSGWKKSMVIDFTVTQTSYSDSWTGGEAGSINWVSNLNGSAEKQLSPKFNYRTSLKLSFGQTHSQNTNLPDKPWKKPQKSTDLIDWENVGKFTFGWFVDPYAAFRVESQFYDGSVPDHKRWLSPMRLTESAGMAKKLYEKDKDFVTSRMGFAIRQLMVKEFIDDVDYKTETISSSDGGIESVTDAELTLHKNIKYTSKLSLFKALYYSEKDSFKGTTAEDYWKAGDVNWENIISASITKIITVNLYTQLLYDKEISVKGRFKETLAIGFVINMI